MSFTIGKICLFADFQSYLSGTQFQIRIQTQEHFPNYSKDHAHIFLYACIWNMEAAKKAIERYGEIRANAPNIFGNRDIFLPSIQSAFDNV